MTNGQSIQGTAGTAAGNGNVQAIERHYTVQEVAQLWGVSPMTIRRIFRDMPGVLKLNVESKLSRKERKHAPHILLRIPESLVRKVHSRWSQAQI